VQVRAAPQRFSTEPGAPAKIKRMTRTGAEYLASLRDGREVWLDGERITDVTAHPAFRNTIRSVAHLYDMTHDNRYRDLLTYESPTTGERVSRGYQIPRSYEDLVARRKAIKLWAEASYGFMGRSPDYMASAITGFASAPEVFARGGPECAENLLRHYEYMRDNDLYQAHTIVNPQIDRTRTAAEQEEPDLYVKVVDERDDGFVVRGAKMVGTAALFGDEILVGTIEPLGKHDRDYAVAFSVPFNTPGVKVLSRTSYERQAKSVFDYPFSSRFDENDSLMIYENVLVPYERCFVYKDVETCYRQWWDTPAFIHFVHHGATRFWTKLELLVGVALKIAKANNTYKLPAVQMQLGRLMSYVGVAKAIVMAAEADYETIPNGSGVVHPNREICFCQRVWAPAVYPRVLEEIKTLAGGGLIQLPSSYKDILDPEIGPLVKRYVRSPGYPAEDRIKLLKLAWDLLGSEFAMRHEQYERFYHGAPHAYLPAALRESHPEVCEWLVDAALQSYSIEDAIAAVASDEPFVSRDVPFSDSVVRTGAAEGPGLGIGVQAEATTIVRSSPLWQ
jgi:4-hydroxyphenylacetate 3-monooxygenase